MFLYIDSLFGEGREPAVRSIESTPDTLSRLYLQAMQEHDRRAVLTHRANGRWEGTPDWRFDRHVIRLALYMREQLGVEPGDRVAIIAEPRPEWLMADYAATGLGAISTGICGRTGGDVGTALTDAGPHVVFVSSSSLRLLQIVPSDFPSVENWIVFDAPAPEGSLEFRTVLDLGGTLDTPERAQSFRALARDLVPDSVAIRHYDGSTNGAMPYSEITHGEVIDWSERWHISRRAQAGDIAYIAAPDVTLDLRLAFYSLIGDGHSTAAFGRPDQLPEQIRDLRPHGILAPGHALAAAIDTGEDRSAKTTGPRGWRRLARLRRPKARTVSHGEATREALGGRARWVGTTTPLEASLVTKLRDAEIGFQNWANGPSIEPGNRPQQDF